MSGRIFITIATSFVAAGGLLGLSSPATANTDRAGAATAGVVWSAVSVGHESTCAIQGDHTMWCWGLNNGGQLGLGDHTTRRVPTQVGTSTIWAQVSSDGGEFGTTCGIRTNHSLWCWGTNDHGQLGLGDTRDRVLPRKVGTGNDWALISVGGTFVCGVRINHSLWCWGDNPYGQLGLGDTKDRILPRKVGTGNDWSLVNGDTWHTCGIRTSHALWCWGLNNWGQLGLGDIGGSELLPRTVGASADWDSVNPGVGYTCGIRTSHTLWCWGYNNRGQLGLGDQTDRSLPSRVGSGTGWAIISAGWWHTCGVLTTRAMWCWGMNGHGELGLGDTRDRVLPRKVGAGNDWTLTTTGYSHTCGIRTNHTLWCWGENSWGQLGLGDTRDRWVPTQV